MKKALFIAVSVVVLVFVLFLTFVHYVPYSEGVRSGELIKISHKGVLVKTWEGELSQGISGAQIFKFSVSGNRKDVIDMLKEYQGDYVKLTYEERYTTFFWWGDTKYFISDVKLDKSPHFNN
jgi:uncharacterized protein YxeA